MSLKQLESLAKDVKVLYVEDDTDLRAAFSMYLKKFFKSVEVCVDGSQGLSEYKKENYDIVITDINMPNTNGLEMSREIKEINPKQHIIIVSAHRDLNTYEEAIRLGIDGYILKPIEFEQVNQILTSISLHVKNTKENIAYKKHLEELVALKTQKIKENYHRDALTGLPNRAALSEKLEKGETNTVLLLNIDNFSIVNNNFGFHIGDRLIQETIKRLQNFQNSIFTLFRMQADEFVFLSNTSTTQEALTLAESIKNHFLKSNVLVEDLDINVSFTMAIDSDSQRDLLRSTSLTIQEIRQVGKNHIGVYRLDSSFEQLQKNNLIWIEKVKGCFHANSFKVFFQAIKNVKTGEVNKYEALSRVITPEGEIVAPYLFLKPLALAGLMSDFTKNMIEMAFNFMQGKNKTVTLNITGEDFKEDYLVEYLEKKRKEYALDAKMIVIEILESVGAMDSKNVLNQLKELKALGYKIAIDDFGTENSNFSRLLTLQVDFIKIDGSFIKNLATDTNSQEIVKAVVLFAHNIGCKVIAEFVHNAEVYDIVKKYDIDFAQGYFISEPKPTLMEK